MLVVGALMSDEALWCTMPAARDTKGGVPCDSRDIYGYLLYIHQ
jgi:hypothetical protein